ncbi:MAG: hypothetical protein ABII79_08360 [bacterium]
MKHLTDDEIQSYLQRDRSDKWAHVENHLGTCADCRKQFLLYEKLGEMVLSTSSNPIPNGFKKIVMRRLKCTQQQRRMTDVIVAVVALACLSIAGSIVLLTPQLKDIVTGYLVDAWECGIQLTSAAGGKTDALAVPLFGIILFMLFAAVDLLVVTKLRLKSEMQR